MLSSWRSADRFACPPQWGRATSAGAREHGRVPVQQIQSLVEHLVLFAEGPADEALTEVRRVNGFTAMATTPASRAARSTKSTLLAQPSGATSVMAKWGTVGAEDLHSKSSQTLLRACHVGG